jgi:glycosyltransferase involved in cell wall biosynthesis
VSRVDNATSRAKVAHISTIDMALRYLLLNQLGTIQDAGYEVHGISAPGPGIPEVEAAGIRTHPVPMTRRFISPWTDLRAFCHLYRVLRRERFTIVHTHTPKAGLLGQYAALLARVPIRVHTIHGLYIPSHANPAVRRLFVLLERLTMLFSHVNLSQNPEDVETAVHEKISRRDRLRLISNGIDLTRFDPTAFPPERRCVIRTSLGLEPNHRVVGMVARFVAEKGYRELLAAAQTIRAAVPEARFLLVGPVEPEKEDALQPSIITTMGLDDIVLFLGMRQDMADLYAAMDVLALPSYREGFPRAPMEAAAIGIPSVVTNIRGCRQTVDDGVTGYLVPVRDAAMLAARLLDLLQDEERRRTFGSAAREKALAEFDERLVFQRVLQAYDDLLDQREAVESA